MRFAAYEEGVRHFDSSMGGLGGCPSRPARAQRHHRGPGLHVREHGASTGVNLEKLMEARKLMSLPFQRSRVRHMALAGLPKGFVLPLDGVRVVEFAHMVMGPTCGLVLADLGADVVKVSRSKATTRAAEGGRRRILPGVQPQQDQPRRGPEARRRRKSCCGWPTALTC